MVDLGFAWSILPLLLHGAVVTIGLSISGMALALILGVPIAIVRLSSIRWLGEGIHLVADFIRTTPLIIQLYFAFYVLPQYGVTLSASITGILVLGIHYSAYTAEAYRSGIEAVPRGQLEAARALNLSVARTWWRVVLPQAVPPMIPALGNYAIAILKDVPILSTITVFELLTTAQVVATEYFRYIEPYTIVGLIFLSLSYPAARLLRAYELHSGGPPMASGF
jgi:polar amino acid transport system permease protein